MVAIKPFNGLQHLQLDSDSHNVSITGFILTPEIIDSRLLSFGVYSSKLVLTDNLTSLQSDLPTIVTCHCWMFTYGLR